MDRQGPTGEKVTLKDLLASIDGMMARSKCPYVVFGASALNFWTRPRMTVDLDVVVSIDPKSIDRLREVLVAKGFKPTQPLLRAFREGRIIKLKIGDTELDLKRARTPHDLEALRRAETFDVEGIPIQVATPEDVVLYKLQSWRLQDQADVQRVKETIKLDAGHLEKWLDLLEKETGSPLRQRWRDM